MAKKISDYVPILKDQGIDYVTAAGVAGLGFQCQTVTVSGSPATITLSTEMADTSYCAIAQGEGNALSVDEGTKTVSGFDVLGGSGEVANIIVIGQLKGQQG